MIAFAEKLKKQPAAPQEKAEPSRETPRIYKPFAVVLCVLFFGALFALFAISVLDTDKTVSETENRALAARPALTASAVFDGSYMTDFETYYTDTFPFRDWLMQLHESLSDFFSSTKTSDDIVLVDRGNKDDFAGQDIDYDDA